MHVTVSAPVSPACTSALALAERGCDSRATRSQPVAWRRCLLGWAGGMLAPWCERESAEELVVELGREALDLLAGASRCG